MDNTFMLFISSLLALAAVGQIQAVQFDVTNKALGTPGGIIFQNQVGVDYSRQLLEKTSQFIWQTFRQQSEADRKNIQRVSMIVDEKFTGDLAKAAAYASNNEIHLSAEYVGGFKGNIRDAITGILYHEMTHVWQWNGNGHAPVGLTEGVADFVRLKAGYAPSNWPKVGEGKQWDEGYGVTAHFLDYCNGLRDGFVADLNRKLRTGYNENFFVQLLGKPVNQLWSDYKSRFGA